MRPAWQRSLIGRIVIAEIAAIVLVCLLLPFATNLVLKQTISRFQNKTMLAQAQAIAVGMQADPNELRVNLAPALRAIFATGYDGRAFVVTNAQRQLLAASAFAAQQLGPAVPLSHQVTCFTAGIVVGCSVPVVVRDNAAWIVVTQDQNGPGAILDDVATSFLLRYLAILIGVLLLLPLGSALLLKRLERKLQTVSHEAAAIGPFNLHSRLDESGLPTEIAILVKAANRLLARLEASFGFQRAFAGDVAHELRTPLATLRLSIDALPKSQIKYAIGEQADRMAHILSQLRDLATVENNIDLKKEQFDLSVLAVEVISDLAPAIVARGQSIALTDNAPEIFLDANRILIGVALSNLIGNASKHTPPGTTIEVILTQDAEISVTDDGPEIPAQRLKSIVQWITRSENPSARSTGLGLSIVQRILDVHDGQLVVDDHQGVGSKLTMKFTGSMPDCFPFDK